MLYVLTSDCCRILPTYFDRLYDGAVMFGTTGRSGSPGLWAFGWPYILGQMTLYLINCFAVFWSIRFKFRRRFTRLLFILSYRDVGSVAMGLYVFLSCSSASIFLRFLRIHQQRHATSKSRAHLSRCHHAME